MNTKEHNDYLKEFKEFANIVLETEDTTDSFLLNAGINTVEGELPKRYRDDSHEIGFKIQSKEK